MCIYLFNPYVFNINHIPDSALCGNPTWTRLWAGQLWWVRDSLEIFLHCGTWPVGMVFSAGCMLVSPLVKCSRWTRSSRCPLCSGSRAASRFHSPCNFTSTRKCRLPFSLLSPARRWWAGGPGERFSSPHTAGLASHWGGRHEGLTFLLHALRKDKLTSFRKLIKN